MATKHTKHTQDNTLRPEFVRFKPLTKDDVTFSLGIEEEGIPVKGNALASGDADVDAECEKEILDRLAGGDTWAWCTVVVTAEWRGHKGVDYLGGCSYQNEKDFVQSGGYYEDMCDEALASLNADLAARVAELADRLETDDYLEAFFSGYVECALLSSTDNGYLGEDHPDNDPKGSETGGNPLYDNFDESDISPEARVEMLTDCRNFIALAGKKLNNLDAEQAGDDFWLTRNGHGAGFWDRGLGKLGDDLSDDAHSFGSCYLYVGDDGQLHVQ